MSQEVPKLPALTPEALKPGEGAAAPAAGGHAGLSWSAIWVVLLSLAAVASALAQLAAGAGSGGFFLSALCLSVCLLAAWYDAATGLIPKQLTYVAILAGLALQSAAPAFDAMGLHVVTLWLGARGPADALAGFALCAAVALFCRLLAQVGGGDMKLLAAIGALVGYHDVRLLLLAALFVALPYALVNLLAAGRLNAAVRVVSIYLLSLVYLGRPTQVEDVSHKHVPLAVPLLLGLMLVRAGMMNWLWFGQ